MSDRLTTVSGKEFDREANKTLVLVAPDGIASVSFCGLAFLNRKPSDIYLAEALTGELPDFFGRAPNMGPSRNNRRRKIDEMLHAIKVAAENAFKKSLAAKLNEFGLSVCGWRGRKGREEPFAYNLVKNKGKAKLKTIEQTKRGWTTLYGSYVSHLPKGYIKKEHEKKIERVASETFEDIDAFYEEWQSCFVELIRLSSKKSGVVGMDAMMVILPSPSIKKIAIKHIPIALQKVSWKFAKQVPIAFSPWVIGQRNFYAPSVMAGGSNFAHFVDDVKIIFHAPKNTKGVTYIGTHSRRNI